MTAAKLKTRTIRDLAVMARKKKVPGWHSMRKDELVEALARQAKAAAAKATRQERAAGSNGVRVNGKTGKTTKAAKKPVVAAKAGVNGHANGNGKIPINGKPTNGRLLNGKLLNGKPVNGKPVNGKPTNGKPTNGKLALGNGKVVHGKPVNGKASASQKKVRTAYSERRLKQIKAKLAEAKDLAFKSVSDGNGHAKDRLLVMVRDPFWLHVSWELTRAGIERARAAMGQYWHGARPVLRLNELSRNGTTSAARRVVRDIEIHGRVNNWYVDVQDPPKTYQLDIGYLSPCGKFFSLARSNVVNTPQPGSDHSFDKNWSEVAKDFERIYAMSGGYADPEGSRELREAFEERLHHPVGDNAASRFGPGAAVGGNGARAFKFHVDTELIVHGATDPDAHVTLRGEPVRLRPDGTFAVRFTLPDRRHVLPVVASSGDGVEQRTIVLAVDRNTKVMEPIIRDTPE